MKQIKFLCDGIRKDIKSKEEIPLEGLDYVIYDIPEKIEGISSIQNETMNEGIYSSIDPDDNIIVLKFEVIFEGEEFNITFHKQTYKIETEGEGLETLEILIEAKDENNKLYEFKISIKNILNTYFKEIYIIKDEENESICTELYSKIHSVENLFRSVINNYMLRKYGVSWFKNNIVENYQQKATEFSSWYNKKYTDFRNIKNELFNLQTNDLIEMLKSSYIDALSKSEIEGINKLKGLLGENSSIVINPKYIGLKSIWETEIKDLLPDNFEDEWNEFSKMRNMIAHNKPICNDLKNDIEDKIENLLKIIEAFEKKVDDKLKSFERKEVERIKEEVERREHQMYYEQECEEAGVNPLKDVNTILLDIKEDDNWSYFMCSLEECLETYKTKVEELSCILTDLQKDTLLNSSSTEEFSRDINSIYNALECLGIDVGEYRFNILDILEDNSTIELQNIIVNDLEGLLNECSDIGEKITYKINELSEEYEYLLLDFNDISNNNIKLKIIGYIWPEHGATDNLKLILTFNEEQIASGEIIIEYGDYEKNFEQGCFMPIEYDDMVINLDEIEKELINYLQDLIRDLDNYYEIIDKIN